ncbi:response regulator transcription factor [Ramlibacter sp. AW1]|uniref:Response regulator transcription factor n=1 Tax=Ramlibacter aurantiacus TaxID=2801330 RepID=A0A936ZGT6_9BURK|nr:response regulator transcription factor [Ramlibacter aurantiacus]MBL0419582.1 response regulator transcription factor [Ramlibacter aurantiacus]
MTQLTETAIRVSIVAQQMMSWGLEQLVDSSPNCSVVASVHGLRQGIGSSTVGAADVVLVDVDDKDDVPLLLEWLEESRCRVIVLTALTDLGLFDQAVLMGLHGVVRKSDPPATLLKAIEKVHLGELWIDRSATSRIFMEMARQKAAREDDPELARIATLTARERQTILAVVTDAAAPGKVIARRLCISEHTLRNHLSSIYSKLDVCNRLDLYAFATRHRLDKPAA